MEDSKDRYIIGLDLSITGTGISVYDKIEQKFVYINTLRTDFVNASNDKRIIQRLAYIGNELSRLFKAYPPESICIEDKYIGRNSIQSAMDLIELHGVVKVVAYWLGLGEKLRYYHPTTIKKYVGKHGHATKQAVKARIKKNLPDLKLKKGHLDESDSVACVITYLIENKYITKWA